MNYHIIIYIYQSIKYTRNFADLVTEHGFTIPFGQTI